jgi:tetratricopeptide (TPR) repeat protein
LLGLTGCQGSAADPEADVLETARKAFLAGQYLKAEDTYQYYLEMFPQGHFRLEAWQRLADVCQDGRDAPADAATLLEAALLEFGADPSTASDLLLRAAQLRQRSKQTDLAAKHYQALLELPDIPSSRRFNAFLQLAQLLMTVNDFSAAQILLEKCVHGGLSSEDSASCAFLQAELLIRLDKTREAEPILREVFANPENPPALRAQAGFSLGQLYEARMDKDAANSLYTQVLPIHPNPLVVKKRLEYLHN